MLFKLLNGESKSIAGAAMLVGFFSFASRFVGFIRDRILAGHFGAGNTLDVYYAAFKIPDFIFSLLVVGALSASFIPLFTKHASRNGGMPGAWRLTNNSLHILALVFAGISLVLFIFADPVAAVIAPGFSAPKQEMVAQFTRVMLLAEFILGASVVYGSVLQSMKRFLIYSLAPIFYNLGIIIGALFLTQHLGPIGLAWGVVLGAFMHFLVQLYGVLSLGYRHQWVLEFDKDTREIFRLMGPRLIGVGVSQLNFVIATVIASSLAVGSVTIFNFAYNIQYFPVGIIGVSYAIAAFPHLSEHHERGEKPQFIQTLSSGIRQVLFLIIPLMLVFLVVRAQIVRVAVGAGAFGWAETILTANTLAFFALSFATQCLSYLLARAFYAMHDTVTPLTVGLVSELITLLGSLYFTGVTLPGETAPLGVVGLGMAFALSSIVNATLLWIQLRTKIGSFDELRILQSFYKMAVAGLVAVLVMQGLKPIVVQLISLDTFLGVFTQGAIAGGAGLLVYFTIAWLLKSEEMKDLLESVTRRFFKKAQPAEPIPMQTNGM